MLDDPFHVLFSADEGAGGAPADQAAGEPDEGDAGWQGPTEEEWQTVVEQNQAFAQLVEEAQRQAQQAEGGGPEPIDPFADDFQQRLDAYLDQRLTPLAAYQVDLQQQEGSARANDILADLQTSQGEFLFADSARRARMEAEDLFPDLVAQVRDPRRAAEAALTQAYENVKAWEEAVGTAYHERQLNQLKTLGSAPRAAPPVAGRSAAQQVTTPEGGNEIDLVAHYFGRR